MLGWLVGLSISLMARRMTMFLRVISVRAPSMGKCRLEPGERREEEKNTEFNTDNTTELES